MPTATSGESSGWRTLLSPVASLSCSAPLPCLASCIAFVTIAAASSQTSLPPTMASSSSVRLSGCNNLISCRYLAWITCMSVVPGATPRTLRKSVLLQRVMRRTSATKLSWSRGELGAGGEPWDVFSGEPCACCGLFGRGVSPLEPVCLGVDVPHPLDLALSGISFSFEPWLLCPPSASPGTGGGLPDAIVEPIGRWNGLLGSGEGERLGLFLPSEK
mmetsp:Transcript_91552/g.238581  ORF Transcript_91552/g.238581 Transcript_91552/m.238581 type:complete len:217 (+) Transcript_91552:1411-2061(+)